MNIYANSQIYSAHCDTVGNSCLDPKPQLHVPQPADHRNYGYREEWAMGPGEKS